MAHEVFVSYATEDSAVAEAAVTAIESLGICCFIAPRDVVAGQEYIEAIVDAIYESRLVVLILSSHSNHSWHVVRELERAISREIPVIPFRIEDIRLSKSMEYLVCSHHWMDAFPPPMEDHIRRLGECVQTLLRRAREEDRLPQEHGGNEEKASFPAAPSDCENPYLNRKMIKDPTSFFGRREELDRIFSRLGGARPQCLSIIGERRMGKSSLLWHIQHPEVYPRHLHSSHQYIFVYLDLQERVAMTVGEFFSLFSQGLKNRETALFSDYAGFKAFAEECEKSRTRMVVLLDEFDKVTMNKNFDPEFFSFLRSMANRYEIAFVTSSARDLQKLCATKEIEVSPFFNIFTPLYLLAFRPDEAEEFVKASSSRAGLSLAPWIELILSLGGYHPFFLQIACAAVFEEVSSRGEVEPAKVKKAFLGEAGDHLRHFWKHLSPGEREVVQMVAGGAELQRKHRHILEEMENRGIAYQGRDSYVFFTPLFSGLNGNEGE